MISSSSRSIKVRALIASVCAVALLSGLAAVSSQGRGAWNTLSMIFLIASAIALIILLHAIAVMAKRTMGGSIKPMSTQERDRGTDSDR